MAQEKVVNFPSVAHPKDEKQTQIAQVIHQLIYHARSLMRAAREGAPINSHDAYTFAEYLTDMAERLERVRG